MCQLLAPTAAVAPESFALGSWNARAACYRGPVKLHSAAQFLRERLKHNRMFVVREVYGDWTELSYALRREMEFFDACFSPGRFRNSGDVAVLVSKAICYDLKRFKLRIYEVGRIIRASL